MSDIAQVLLLIHIFALGIPMIVASVFLLLVTLRIRRTMGQYRIEMTIFRGILVIGYLFVLISVMHLVEEVMEWYGFDIGALAVDALWHGAVLLVLVVVSYSFHQYLKVLKPSERT